MSKAVLLSIQPKWCEKIASGEKTIEIRKTQPKIKAPFKCYIYQTGMCGVIGEFICDKISMNFVGYVDGIAGYHDLVSGSCVSNSDLMEYGKWRTLYGWHISNLQIYDNPKPLGDFQRAFDRAGITRPPQSWCYVEEQKNNAESEEEE